MREDILPSRTNAWHETMATSSCLPAAPWQRPSRPDGRPQRRSRDGAAPRRARRASCRCSRRPCARQPCEPGDARASHTQMHR